MGFGAMFLGFMLLYDAQIALRHQGEETVYAILDIFPDALGWILLFVGLKALTEKAEQFRFLRNSTLFFLVLSLFSLGKETLLYSVFYSSDGSTQVLSGAVFDVCEHLLTLVFIYLLFQKTAALCKEKREKKLSSFHNAMSFFVIGEGVLYVLAKVARLVFTAETTAVYVNALSMLDFLFWICLVWYGAIALFRAMMRLSD